MSKVRSKERDALKVALLRMYVRWREAEINVALEACDTKWANKEDERLKPYRRLIETAARPRKDPP